MKRNIFVICMLCLMVAGLNRTIAQTNYVPTVGNMATRKNFQDMKFGLFIHWGLYSILGDGEWVMYEKRSLTIATSALQVFSIHRNLVQKSGWLLLKRQV